MNKYNYLLICCFFFPLYTVSFLPNAYSPLSALLLAPFGSILFLANPFKLDKSEFLLFLFVLYIFFVSLINAAFLFSINLSSMMELVPLFVGFFTYVALFRLTDENNVYSLLNVLIISGKLVLLYGIFEVLCLIGMLPREFRTILNEFFSGMDTGRVQLILREASWAAQYLLYLFPIILFSKIKHRLPFLVLIGVFLLLTFSLNAFFVLFIALYFYFFFLSENKLKLLQKTLVYFVILYFVSFALYQLVSIYTEIYGTNYALSRVMKLGDVNSFESILLLDGSVYLRVMYPYYAILIGIEYPLGVGAVSYSEVFNSMFHTFPFSYIGAENQEVIMDIRSSTADPRGLMTSIWAYGGIPSVFLFLVFVIITLKNVLNIEDRNLKKVLLATFLLSMANGLQFGSLAYFPLWFSAALINSYCKDVSYKT